ncbi:MAG: DUF4145 domain-containing protein [Microcoleus vaginatus WJT46-NPBG5]|jgi:hypothetical protein|nr:DUF4145 domain-containing protein [Microcoleus vaginatus WJT46-NPBG5]
MNYQKDFEFFVNFELKINDVDPDYPPFYEITRYTPYSINGICPNCNIYASFNIKRFEEVTEKYSQTIEFAIICFCPNVNCREKTIFAKAEVDTPFTPDDLTESPLFLKTIGLIKDIFPSHKTTEIEIPEEIPDVLREDYFIAQKVLEISPKLTSIMARLIIEKFIKYTHPTITGTLMELIEEFIKVEKSKRHIPPDLEDDLTHIRSEGNDVVHSNPNKNQLARDEEEAALFNLSLLDDLFNFYYIRPAEKRRKYHENVEKAKQRKNNMKILKR